MADSRYSHLDSETNQSGDYFNTRSTSFSNTLADVPQDSTASPDYNPRTDRQLSESYLLSDLTHNPSPDDVPPYRDFTEGAPSSNFANKDRRRTGNTQQSNSSSLWSRTRERAVSNLAVAKVASPWEHGKPKDTTSQSSTTERIFDRQAQRTRLFVNSIFQFFVTILLCAAIAGTLKGFSTIEAMTQSQKHWFNAVITGLSIALGINLAYSFSAYAQMMRWRFLASSYRSLQEFELVMQSGDVSKVFQLLWTARTPDFYFLNKTQTLCLLWIFVNAGLQVLVALIGLTYNLDQSSEFVTTHFGKVSIVDLQVIAAGQSDVLPIDVDTQRLNAYDWGIVGQNFNYSLETGPPEFDSPETIYTNSTEWNYAQYWFIDQDPTESSITLSTQRQINVTASCQNLTVIAGANGSTYSVTYLDTNGKSVDMYFDDYWPAGVTYMSNYDSTCGPRCTEVFAFQTTDGVTIFEPSLYRCNVTVGLVTGIPASQEASYQMPDEQAQIVAGSIAWEGGGTDGTTFEYRAFPQGTLWSPYYRLNATTVRTYITGWAMDVVAAMDYSGRRIIALGADPGIAQVVDVQWNYAAILLGIIPAIQFIALLCIIRWANKAIIKDNSFLGSARLLRPIVDKLGERGCLLTGNEIARELKNIRVTYGARSPPGYVEGSDMVRHVDILEEDEGLGIPKRMLPGRYDGLADAGCADLRHRNRSRSI